MLFNVQDFSKYVLVSQAAQICTALSHEHTGPENQPGLDKKSLATYRENLKEFLDFPKIAQQHSRGACVCQKRRMKPKIDQQILSTRMFTTMNTEMSCAFSTPFHLGTDVR